MNEIEKLRKRLTNVRRGVTEYRMTVDEAKRLLAEIDKATEIKPAPAEKVNVKPVRSVRIIDGGSF